MSSSAPSRLPREAGAPFDVPDADIILRSVDGVDFRTYKSYLIQALHGFDDMLQTGHLNGIGEAEEMQDGRLIVPLPEPSPVLDLFLRTLYPVNSGCPALISKLNLLPGVCQALSKYCVKNFPLSIKDALMLAADKEPELVYVISCRYTALSDVARVAAKNTLRKVQRLDNVPEKMVPELSAMQYHAIAKYQVACRAAAVEACKPYSIKSDLSWTPGAVIVRDIDSSGCTCMMHDEEWIKLVEVTGHPDYPDFETRECMLPEWLVQYLADVRGELAKGDNICGSVALKSGYMAKAIDAGRECVVCCKEVGEFLAFAKSLAGWIDDAVGCVVFHSYAVA